MESKKLNVELVQSYLDAAEAKELASKAMAVAESNYEAACVTVLASEQALIADDEMIGIIQSTGIRTLNDKLVTIDINGLSISNFVKVPAMWEFNK